VRMCPGSCVSSEHAGRLEENIPSSDDVMIVLSWNPSQQIGSFPTTLDYGLLAMRVTVNAIHVPG
jgi:hypothetical protein